MDFLNVLNGFDIFIIITFTVLMLIGWHKGLLLSFYNLLSFVLSIAISNAIYPAVSKFLKESGVIYGRIASNVSDALGFTGGSGAHGKAMQNAMIEAAGLPDFLTTLLIENNNPEIYKLLNVSVVEEYIVGFITGILINIIAMVSVFILVSLIMSIISKTLNIVSKLPVIHSFNKLGGLLFGAVSATLAVWLIFIVMLIFVPGRINEFMAKINDSLIARYLFEHNLLLDMLLGSMHI